MIPQTSWSANQPILHRPRLNSLIWEGLKHPLLVMLAAPGYGKTQAMADYTQTCDAETIWLHLRTTDNLPNRFWKRLIQTITQQHPELSEHLQALTFPENIYGFDPFIQLMEESICKGHQIIWVFDDYGVIDNQQIKSFIRILVDAALTNFHLVLLSNALDSMDSIAFMTTRRALLLANELRFNKNEIREFYRLYGIKLSAIELDSLERYTEGWPMPLCLLASRHGQLPALTQKGKSLTYRVISYLFEERFFSAYPLKQQKTLVKLAMMDSFTKSFALDLYEGNAAELEHLENHAFFINEPTTERFYLHHLYRTFLQDKQYLLTAKDQKDFWKKTAQYYMACGDILDAIPCFFKCGDRINMLDAIKKAVLSQAALSDKLAAYFLELLDSLTEKEVNQYPVADCIRAVIYTFTYQLTNAETLVIDLEQRLSKQKTPEIRALLGEVFITHGLIRMMQAQNDFGQYYKQAIRCLPSETAFYNPGSLKVYNHFSFFMPDNSPGSKEQIEQAIHQGVPWMQTVMGGSMSGMPYLFSSEVAYLSGQMDKARQYAYRTIYEAEAQKQHDLVCNAYHMLIRAEFALGHLAQIENHLNSISEYGKKYELSIISEIRETTQAWYYIKMYDFKRIPKSILLLDSANNATISYGRIHIVYANYLVSICEYAKLVGLLEHLKHMRPFQSITIESISLYIMLSVGYHGLGSNKSAMKALWRAYEMCHSNGLITLFCEAEKHMLKLISAARQQNEYRFSPTWLNEIERETALFIKRADAVRAAYKKQNPSKSSKNNPLSKRERAVLQSVARGLTREEIALEQYISMNTVKSTITSIFNKLGANNKADAVSIAITRGYIDGYAPEY